MILGGRRGRVPGRPGGRDRSRAEAEDHRRKFIEVFEREAGKVKADFLAQGTTLPRRDRKLRHRRRGPGEVPPQRGRPARLHEAASWWSPCASCSRTRCAGWAWPWACPRTWSGATPSPAPDWPCASPAASPRERVTILQNADAIFIEELKASGWYRNTCQCFAVLLPVHDRGHHGRRAHLREHVRPAGGHREDFMTADWARLPHELLEKVAQRIVNEVQGHQPGGLRHHQQAPGDHRVRIARTWTRPAGILEDGDMAACGGGGRLGPGGPAPGGRTAPGGARVTVLSRARPAAPGRGAGTTCPEALAGADAVINLCGEGIADRRWSASAQAGPAGQPGGAHRSGWSAAMGASGVLVNASAVGIYGALGDRPVDEAQAPGKGFLAEALPALGSRRRRAPRPRGSGWSSCAWAWSWPGTAAPCRRWPSRCGCSWAPGWATAGRA